MKRNRARFSHSQPNHTQWPESVKELDGLAPPSPTCLGHDHSWRKWRAIRETAGASVNLANVSMGAYHITVKTLYGKSLT